MGDIKRQRRPKSATPGGVVCLPFWFLNFSGGVESGAKTDGEMRFWRALTESALSVAPILDLFYSGFKNKVKQNHIFSAIHKDSWDGNQFLVDLRESDLPEHGIVKHMSIKTGFHGRSSYPKGIKGLKQAVENRKEDIKNAKGELLKQIKAPGTNI